MNKLGVWQYCISAGAYNADSCHLIREYELHKGVQHTRVASSVCGCVGVTNILVFFIFINYVLPACRRYTQDTSVICSVG